MEHKYSHILKRKLSNHKHYPPTWPKELFMPYIGVTKQSVKAFESGN